MADEFATPIEKLKSISTRDADGSKTTTTDALSYDDILRQQLDSQRDEITQQQPPPPPRYQNETPQYQQAPPTPQHEMSYPQPPMQRYPQQAYEDTYYSPPPQRPIYQPLDTPVHETSKEDSTTPWWKKHILQNKVAIIAAIIIFLTLVYVMPKLSSIQRFAATGVPKFVLGAVAATGGCLVSAANMSI